MSNHQKLAWFAFGLAAAAYAASAQAQFPTSEVPTSEAAYTAKAKTAAPAAIVDRATIVMRQGDGGFKTLQNGSNGFTCLVNPDGTPACADANGLEWMRSVAGKTAPPNKTGFIYMLAGDTGTSNHDPYANDRSSHWVQTGPHVMIVGAAAREMAGLYPRTLDADPSLAYVMFPGTQYEHLMLPVIRHGTPRSSA